MSQTPPIEVNMARYLPAPFDLERIFALSGGLKSEAHPIIAVLNRKLVQEFFQE